MWNHLSLMAIGPYLHETKKNIEKVYPLCTAFESIKLAQTYVPITSILWDFWSYSNIISVVSQIKKPFEMEYIWFCLATRNLYLIC